MVGAGGRGPEPGGSLARVKAAEARHRRRARRPPRDGEIWRARLLRKGKAPLPSPGNVFDPIDATILLMHQLQDFRRGRGLGGRTRRTGNALLLEGRHSGVSHSFSISG